MPLNEGSLALLNTLAELVEPLDSAPPAPAEIERAEAVLGRAFPDELRWWLEHVGPATIAGNELNFCPTLMPTDEDDRSEAIATAADQLREWEWDIPDELIVFGDNGGGDILGLWAPRDADAIPAVILVGMGHDEDDPCIWVLGESLSAFMRAWILDREDDDPAGVGAKLGIPASLWPPPQEQYEEGDPRLDPAEDDDDGAVTRALLRYTSPRLGDLVTEPWGRRISTAEIRAALAR